MKFCLHLCLVLTNLCANVLANETDASAKYTVDRDVVFSEIDGEKLTADIYQPSKVKEKCPVILIVHGGAWMSGDKTMPYTFAQLFAKHSMAAVSINYRLAPQHKFPAQIDDVRSAIAWISDSAEDRGWDVERFAMFGYSAGAHLCCMIGTAADEDKKTQLKASRIPGESAIWSKQIRPVAIVAGGAPCDLRPLPEQNSMLSYFLGGTRAEVPEVYVSASPTAFASAGDVPTLFYHGTNDALVSISSSRTLHDKLEEAGVECEFVEIENLGHLLSFMHKRSRESTIEYLTERLKP